MAIYPRQIFWLLIAASAVRYLEKNPYYNILMLGWTAACLMMVGTFGIGNSAKFTLGCKSVITKLRGNNNGAARSPANGTRRT
jgi:hypothetical protein